MQQVTALPAEIGQGLDEFLEEARKAFGGSLVSAVLFGSAAEGRLRATSDVNLLLLLRKFDRASAEMIRGRFRTAHAAFRLNVMFLLEKEIGPAMDAFAVKFSDILSRRRVLFGPDPFAELVITPEAICRRTKQVLMNLLLRMRERFVLVSLREEQIAPVIADVTGPMRACAATILKLEGTTVESPREAMAKIVSELEGEKADEVIRLIDMARRQEPLPHGTGAALLFTLMDLAERMIERADRLAACKGAECRV